MARVRAHRHHGAERLSRPAHGTILRRHGRDGAAPFPAGASLPDEVQRRHRRAQGHGAVSGPDPDVRSRGGGGGRPRVGRPHRGLQPHLAGHRRHQQRHVADTGKAALPHRMADRAPSRAGRFGGGGEPGGGRRQPGPGALRQGASGGAAERRGGARTGLLHAWRRPAHVDRRLGATAPPEPPDAAPGRDAHRCGAVGRRRPARRGGAAGHVRGRGGPGDPARAGGQHRLLHAHHHHRAGVQSRGLRPRSLRRHGADAGHRGGLFPGHRPHPDPRGPGQLQRLRHAAVRPALGRRHHPGGGPHTGFPEGRGSGLARPRRRGAVGARRPGAVRGPDTC